MGTSPGDCILRMLIVTPGVFIPSSLSGLPIEEGPVLAVWQSGFELPLLPQVGKARINSGAAGRGKEGNCPAAKN